MSGPAPRGTQHHSAKLTEEQVREIHVSTERVTDLAERYGVSKSVVSKIKNGRIWRHVTAPKR